MLWLTAECANIRSDIKFVLCQPAGTCEVSSACDHDSGNCESANAYTTGRYDEGPTHAIDGLHNVAYNYGGHLGAAGFLFNTIEPTVVGGLRLWCVCDMFQSRNPLKFELYGSMTSVDLEAGARFDRTGFSLLLSGDTGFENVPARDIDNTTLGNADAVFFLMTDRPVMVSYLLIFPETNGTDGMQLSEFQVESSNVTAMVATTKESTALSVRTTALPTTAAIVSRAPTLDPGIIGGAIGGGVGVVLIAAISACVYFLRSRRPAKDENSSVSDAVGLNSIQPNHAVATEKSENEHGIYAGVPPALLSGLNRASYASVEPVLAGDHPYDDVADVLAR